MCLYQLNKHVDISMWIAILIDILVTCSWKQLLIWKCTKPWFTQMVHEPDSEKVCSSVHWCRKVVRKCELRKLNKHETEIKRCSDTWLWIIEVVIVLFLCFRKSYKVASTHSMSHSGRDSSQ